MYHNRVFIYLYKSSPDIPSNINLCKKKKKRKGKQHIQKTDPLMYNKWI